jgi:hypothetical protein
MKGAALHLIDLAALTSSEVQLAKRALGNHRECNVIRPILHGPVYDEAIFGQIGLNVAMRWEDPMLDLELIQINKLRDIGKTWYLILFIESAQPIVLEVLPNSSPIDAPFGHSIYGGLTIPPSIYSFSSSLSQLCRLFR